MITKQTVLILGAGASAPYGYPLPNELRKEILNKLKDADIQRDLKERLGYSDFLIDNFASAYAQSGTDNLEEFLVQRNEFIEIGTHILTITIREHESLSELFDTDDWYEYLFKQTGDTLENFAQNKLSIITFNFDRSLEAYLFEALRNTYGKRQEEIVGVLKKIQIIHIYGQVGSLSWQGGIAPSEYGAILKRPEISNMSKGIIIDNKDQIKMAKELLQNADVVAFLGFGYSERSMEMLGISDLENKTILGSTYGMKSGEIKSIARKSGGKITFPNTKVAQALDCKDFLKESGVLGL